MLQYSFLHHKNGDIAIQYMILFSALTISVLALGTLFQALFTTQTCLIREKIASLTVSSALNTWGQLTALQRRQLIWKQKIHPFLKEAFAYGEQNTHMTLQNYLPIYLSKYKNKKDCSFESHIGTANVFYRKYLDSSSFFSTQEAQAPRFQNDKMALRQLQNYINQNANDKSLQRFFSP